MALAGVAVGAESVDLLATFTSSDKSKDQTWEDYSAKLPEGPLTLTFTGMTITDGTKNGSYTEASPGNQFTTSIRPNANVCHGGSPASYTLNFTVSNVGEELIDINVITFHTFLYSAGGNGHNYNNFAQTAFNCGLAYGADYGTTFESTHECPAAVLSTTNGTLDVQFSLGDKFVSLGAGEQCNFAVTFSKDKGNGSFIGLSGATFNIIPEPATATLSLLALAGLAARRRRK